MTNNNHPITPPEELIDEWESEWHHCRGEGTYEVFMAKQAARWGADQELEACCEILRGEFNYHHLTEPLRAARRPKPLSLKEQALALISHDPENQPFLSEEGIAIIRRALETLPND